MPFTTPRPLQVLPMGCGDAFARTDYFVTLLVFGGETMVLIDCPDPFHKILHERAHAEGIDIDADDISDLVLTHLHGDHCNGLESLLFHRKFVREGPPVTIHTIPEISRALWTERLAVSMEVTEIPERDLHQDFAPEDFYHTRSVRPLEPFAIGDLEFELHRTVHSVPTFGMRIRHGGRCFAYSCDTAYGADYMNFLAEGDLIFHDCGKEPLHARYDDLLGAPAPVREKMHILHLADGFDRAGSALKVVEPGRLYTV